MEAQQIATLLLGTIILFFVVLITLIAKNILQHRKIYSFRSEDKVWDHWKSQVFGLTLFILGFLFFIICFFGYIYLSNPEFFGVGLNLTILIQNPLDQIHYIINIFLGFGIAIAGTIVSITSINKFIKNIESAKGG